MRIQRLSDLRSALKDRPVKRLVAVNATDEHTLQAIAEAVDSGFISAFVTGDPELIRHTCVESGIDIKSFSVVEASSEEEAALKAIEMITSGKADILMKGLLSTDKFMRVILDKDNGLVPPKGVLSHVSVMQNPPYHKLLIVSDVAIIPYPDLNQKIAMVGYLIDTARALGIETPKIALLAATEQVLPSIPACTEAAIISKMAERGQIKGALIDGPMAFDVAVDKASAHIKGVESPVAGDVDCILFPNIDAGNLFYKMSARFCKSEQAAIVAGAKVPIVLSSRSDSAETKLWSIALAALMG